MDLKENSNLKQMEEVIYKLGYITMEMEYFIRLLVW